MSEFVRIEPLDLVVYGQVQYAFIAEDAPGQLLAYDQAVARAALRRAVAVDTELQPMASAIRARTRKLQDLGLAMGSVSSVLVQMEEDKETYTLTNESDKITLGYVRVADSLYGGSPIVDASGRLVAYEVSVSTVLDYYKVSISPAVSNNEVSYSQVNKLQQTLKLAIDKENSAVERDSSSVQSYMQKSNSAYSLIGTLQRKIDGTASRTIGQLGS